MRRRGKATNCSESAIFRARPYRRRVHLETVFFMTRKRVYQPREIQVDGVTYRSRTSCCKKLNITYDYVVKRMESKLETFEVAVSAILRNRSERNGQRLGQRIPVSYKGTPYRSLRALCASLGVKYTTVVDRVARGADLEKAIEESLSPFAKVTVHNIDYPNLSAAAAANHVAVARVRRRMALGLSPQDAIEHVKKSKRKVRPRSKSPITLSTFLQGVNDRLEPPRN